MANLKNTNIDDNLELPSGTTSERPASPQEGQIRYNTDLETVEFYNGSNWRPLSDTHLEATGGTVVDTDIGGVPYRIHYFTETGTDTLTVTNPGEVEYLIVAGGGGGGSTDRRTAIGAGGGGAGGLLQGSATVSAQSYTVTVGTGGAADPGTPTGTNGGNSTAFGLTALGGGGGGNRDAQDGGADGGSGGGAAYRGGTPGQALQPGSADGGFGNNGGSASDSTPWGSGGGGGGAGSRGRNSTSQSQIGPDEDGGGGHGIQSLITGANQFYAGGGAGGLGRDDPDPAPVLPGGLGGGANGQRDNTEFEDRTATPNTGGGAGGAMSSSRAGSNQDGGNGGSGIVVIRYPLRQENPVVAAGKTVGDGLVLDLDFAKPTVYSGSGSVVTDSRLNGVEGDLRNGVGYTFDRTHRSSLVFDGINDHVRIIDDTWPKTGDDLTVLAWVYREGGSQNGSDYQSILNSTDDGSLLDFSFFVSGGGSLAGWVRNSSNSSSLNWNSDVQINLNQWYFVGFTVDNGQTSTVRGYIDGNLAVTNSQSGTRFNNSPRKTIGTYVNRDRYEWNGKIAYEKVWTRRLTDTEIQQEFEATRWRFGV